IATTGRTPCVASPAAKVVACASAMPTSKNRSGHFFWKMLVPVPDGMAAVMVTKFDSSAASCVSASPNTLVHCGSPGLTGLSLPVTGSYGARALERLHDIERMQHLADVVTVDRSEVAEAQLLEQHPRRPEILDALFHVLRKVDELLAADDMRRALDQMLDPFADPHGDRARDDRAEVFVERADVGRDRHAVVVQHDDDVSARVAGVVERFVRQAAGHRPIAHHRDDLELLALQIARGGHSVGGRQRGARVTGAELVML